MKFIFGIFIITILGLQVHVLANDKFLVSFDVPKDQTLDYFNGVEQERLQGQDLASIDIKNIFKDEKDKQDVFLLNKKNDIKTILAMENVNIVIQCIKWLIEFRSFEYIKPLLIDVFNKNNKEEIDTIFNLLHKNNEKYKKSAVNYENEYKERSKNIPLLDSGKVKISKAIVDRSEKVIDYLMSLNASLEYALDNNDRKLISEIFASQSPDIIFKEVISYYVKNLKKTLSSNIENRSPGFKHLNSLDELINSDMYKKYSVQPNFAYVNDAFSEIANELQYKSETEEVLQMYLLKFLNFFELKDGFMEYKLEKAFLSDNLTLSLSWIKFIDYLLKEKDPKNSIWQYGGYINLICEKDKYFFIGDNNALSVLELLNMFKNSGNEEGFLKVVACLRRFNSEIIDKRINEYLLSLLEKIKS